MTLGDAVPQIVFASQSCRIAIRLGVFPLSLSPWKVTVSKSQYVGNWPTEKHPVGEWHFDRVWLASVLHCRRLKEVSTTLPPHELECGTDPENVREGGWIS